MMDVRLRCDVCSVFLLRIYGFLKFAFSLN